MWFWSNFSQERFISCYAGCTMQTIWSGWSNFNHNLTFDRCRWGSYRGACCYAHTENCFARRLDPVRDKTMRKTRLFECFESKMKLSTEAAEERGGWWQTAASGVSWCWWDTHTAPSFLDALSKHSPEVWEFAGGSLSTQRSSRQMLQGNCEICRQVWVKFSFTHSITVWDVCSLYRNYYTGCKESLSFFAHIV